MSFTLGRKNFLIVAGKIWYPSFSLRPLRRPATTAFVFQQTQATGEIENEARPGIKIINNFRTN